MKRNILSFNDVNRCYDVTWDGSESCFKVRNANEQYSFVNISNVFCRTFVPTENMLTTVKENKRNFSIREVKQAELVREIQKRLAFESDSSLMNAIKHGTINNLPITVRDVQNANSILGPNIAALKGKSTAKKPILSERLEINRSTEKDQIILIDLIYINGETFLVALSNPLNMITTHYLGSGTNSKTSSILEKVVHQIVSTYRGESFHVHSVLSDNEPVMLSLQSTLESLGIKHNLAGIKSNHLSFLDRKIRLLKDQISDAEILLIHFCFLLDKVRYIQMYARPLCWLSLEEKFDSMIRTLFSDR